MNVNYQAGNKENKKLELEKKNKKGLSENIEKVLGYMGLTVAGVASFSIAGKIIYDKLNKNDNELGSQQNKRKTIEDNIQENNLKGAPADNYDPNVTIRDKNYLVAFWQRPLADSYCFHNVWLQLLAGPDIRRKKYGLPNTDKSISGINKIIAENKDTMTLKDKYNDGSIYQSEAIDVPKEIRLQPEIKFKNPFTNEEIDVTNHELFDVRRGAVSEGKGGASFPYDVSGILNVCYSKKINVSDFMPGQLDTGAYYKVMDLLNNKYEFYHSWAEVPAVLLDLGVIKISNTPWRFYGVQDYVLPQCVKNGNGPENFLAQIQLTNNRDNNKLPPHELIQFMRGFYGYKPTFGIMRFNAHYVSFYIFYDKNSNIKRVLYNADQGFEQYSDNDGSGRTLQDFYKYIFDHHAPLWLKYSNQDIVKKYYTE